MVGKTEAQLTRAGISYEVGVADYREVRLLVLANSASDASFSANSGRMQC